MKRIIILLLLLQCLVPVCRAKRDTDSSKSLLWKISGHDMKRPSYLFGTIHLICPEDYLWTPVMQQSLENAEQVCLEMDLDDPELAMKIAKGMVSDNDSTLKDYFTEEEYNALNQFVRDSFGMDLTTFEQLKPATLETILTTNIINCQQPLTYENEIMAAAKKMNKEISGIEEPEEQIALLNALPADSIVGSIIDIIKKNSDSKQEYQKLVEAYKNQDLYLLYRLMNEAEGMTATTLDIFLNTRNEKWIERMIDKMDQRSMFFAFGAAHLPGEKGVITLLRNAGYTVEPLK